MQLITVSTNAGSYCSSYFIGSNSQIFLTRILCPETQCFKFNHDLANTVFSGGHLAKSSKRPDESVNVKLFFQLFEILGS